MPLKSRGSASARLSVWFSDLSALRERGEIGLQHLQPAGVERPQRRLALHEVQRRPPLRARLGKGERPVVELEHCERDPAGRSGAGRQPAQPPRDHQVDHEEELALELEHDPLADPAEADGRVCPRRTAIGGTAVRRTNGEISRTRSSVRPTTRRSSASM